MAPNNPQHRVTRSSSRFKFMDLRRGSASTDSMDTASLHTPTSIIEDSQAATITTDAPSTPANSSAMDIDDGAYESNTNDWDPAYLTTLIALFDSGMSENEILQLPSEDITGVNLLHLGLTHDFDTLLQKYNGLHREDQLYDAATKRRFSNAFHDVAEAASVSVADLKKAYNKVTKGARTRMRGTRQNRIQPILVLKKPSKPKPEVESSETTTPKRRTKRKKIPENGMIGAPKEELHPLVEKSEGETAAEERLAQTLALKSHDMDVPRLPFYHAIIRVLNDGKEITHLNLENLHDIRKLGATFTAEAIVLSVNSWIPGCTTTEQVRDVINAVHAEVPTREVLSVRPRFRFSSDPDEEVMPP